MSRWLDVVQEAPSSKEEIKAGCRVNAKSLSHRFSVVTQRDPHTFCTIRSAFFEDIGEFINFAYSKGLSARAMHRDVLQLLSEFCGFIPHLKGCQEEIMLLEHDDPSDGGLDHAISLIDGKHITADAFAIQDPWESLRWMPNTDPVQLLEGIKSCKIRLSRDSARTEADIVLKFLQLVYLASVDEIYDPSSYSLLRVAVLSPAARKDTMTYSELYALLSFSAFPPLLLKTARPKRAAESFPAEGFAGDLRSMLDHSIKDALKAQASEVNQASEPRKPDGSKVAVGRSFLKNMTRLVQHGVFGPGLVAPSWTLNPARLDCTVDNRRCNDGKCALECPVCYGRVTDPSTAIVKSTSIWQKENGPITQSNFPDESTTVLLHYFCQCRYAHMKVNDYIRDNPDEDCRWMLEAHTEAEWEALCKASNVTVWTPNAGASRRT
jgi:hypothetical protein